MATMIGAGHPSAWMMLQHNLLYTGITRAKKLVVLAGSRRALAAAVRTALTHRLQQRHSPPGTGLFTAHRD